MKRGYSKGKREYSITGVAELADSSDRFRPLQNSESLPPSRGGDDDLNTFFRRSINEDDSDAPPQLGSGNGTAGGTTNIAFTLHCGTKGYGWRFPRLDPSSRLRL